ncbi:MAG: hypothetical protein WKF61_09065 [Luteimonas sp.]
MIPNPRTLKIAGATLVAASALAVLAMSHHPTAHGGTPEAWVGEMARIGGLSRAVHAAMIGTVIAIWLALDTWSDARGGRGAVRVAARLYGLGALAMIGAALLNGFAVDALAARALQSGPDAVQGAARLVPLTWALNQTLAGFGVFMLSGGIAAWSLDLWRTPGALARTTAGYGVLTTVLACVAYALGLFRLDVMGMGAVVVAQGVWYVLVGIVMWLSAIEPGSTR